MTIDLTTYVIVTAVSTLIGLVILYFVIKNAVKNALIEDRAFQAKVEKLRKQQATPPAPHGGSRA